MRIEGAVEAERALGLVLRRAVEQLGAAALGAVVLPDLETGTLSASALRSASALLWASQIEEAGLPGFVEALAEQVSTGRFQLMIDRGADRLARYWRDRHERHTAAERRALYSRLFGGAGDVSPNVAFAADWEALITALLAQDGAPPTTAHRAQIAAAARLVAEPLATRATGSARYDAERILAHIDEAFRLLREPDIARAFGGQSPWTIIALYSPELMGRRIQPTGPLARARAGQSILSWMADEANAIAAGSAPVHPAVIDAAARWRGAR